MATQVKFRRDTRTNLLLSTPVEGEIGVDTTNDRLILGDGSTSGGIPQASYKDIQNNLFTAADAAGTDTITLDLDDAPTAYAEYQSFTFKPANNNTGAATLNVNSLGAKNIKKEVNGSLEDLEADDLKQNIPVTVIYDGTQFIVQLGGSSGAVWTFASVPLSGDEVDILTGLSGVSEIIIGGSDIEKSTNTNLYFQLGDSGGYETSGYQCTSSIVDDGAVSSVGEADIEYFTNGWHFAGTVGNVLLNATVDIALYARFVKLNEAGTIWTATVQGSNSTAHITASGVKTLSAELDRIRITTESAVGALAGTAYVAYR